jgi:hypothetical protein
MQSYALMHMRGVGHWQVLVSDGTTSTWLATFATKTDAEAYQAAKQAASGQAHAAAGFPAEVVDLRGPTPAAPPSSP